jgi:4-hydroxy-2-oxoheptanedioate aldolase
LIYRSNQGTENPEIFRRVLVQCYAVFCLRCSASGDDRQLDKKVQGTRWFALPFAADSEVPRVGNISMQWIDRQRLSSELMAGTFLNLGCSAAVEIAAGLGFDWVLLDIEHGSGSWADLRPQLLAVQGTSAAPIVRVRSLDADDVKFVMDSGAAGIMFPYVANAVEAAQAVRLMKYPPVGVRGVAQVIRATDYGRNWQRYLAEANERSLVIVQIETPDAVAQADEIAGVPGVDVLFVGPMDLSVNMGHAGDFTQPLFLQHLQTVVKACAKHGKTAGILSRPELVEQHKALGFRFVALGSDASAIAQGMTQNLAALRRQGLVGTSVNR